MKFLLMVLLTNGGIQVPGDASHTFTAFQCQRVPQVSDILLDALWKAWSH